MQITQSRKNEKAEVLVWLLSPTYLAPPNTSPFHAPSPVHHHPLVPHPDRHLPHEPLLVVERRQEAAADLGAVGVQLGIGEAGQREERLQGQDAQAGLGEEARVAVVGGGVVVCGV